MKLNRLTRVLLLCPLLLLLLQTSVWAQSKTVTGTVTDDKGAALQGVSVLVKGTNIGTQTDVSGNFSLAVPETATTLTFSYVGFVPQDINIEGKNSVNVSLVTQGQTNLNEVVVIGYGTARKKDVTGSVASVTSKNFNQGVIAAPDQLFQNKVAGLEVTANSGQPGAATTIKIRGNNSIRTANNPLYVVDGVPLDGRTAKPSLDLGTAGLGFGTTPESNPLLYINPNDIAQIDVLKDASSAAIYGSRGANGVIVITTKKGTSGPTKLEVGTNFGAFAGYMKKYDILSASQFRNALKTYQLDTLSGNTNPYDAGSSVDALKAITSNDLTQNYSLAFSGGNETGKFRASFLGSKTAGFLKKTSLDKYLANLGGTYKFLDKRLTLDFNLIAGHTTENMSLISNTPGAGGALISWALNWNPTSPFYDENGQFNNTVANNYAIPNPLAVIDAYSDVADVNTFLGNVSASLELAKGLTYKFLYAVNHGAGTRKTNIEGWVAGIQGLSGSGFAAISNAALTSQTFTHTLNYNTNLTSNLRFDAVAGYEYWKSSYENSSLAAKGFNTNLVQATRTDVKYTSFMQNASTQFPLTYSSDPNTEIQSVFGRVNFNLSDKYYLTGTLRADGSNKFGKNNRYGYFPSVGAKWNISNEGFLKGSSTFTNLSLRASWGITGNQEFPSGASLEQISSSQYNSVSQTNVANPDLKWEKTTSVNIGLDFGLFKNVSGSIDYYHKNTTDLLFQSTAIQPAPASIYFINLPADLINSGVEFGINATLASQKQFTWDAGFNIAYNKNMLKHFNQAPILTGTINGNGLSDVFAQRITNNQPVDVFYLKPFRGFDQSGNQIVGDTAFYTGDPNPHVIAGFSSTLRYNKFSLTFNLGGAFGYQIYNNTLNGVTNIYQFGKGQNVSNSVLGTGEGVSSGAIASDRYLESGNYIKLRNATLNYAVGDVGTYIKNLNVFVGGTNLFVITKYTGFDPEVNTDKSNNNYPSRSIEYLPYPTPRIITFGLNFGL
ncbi:SusC/RagA family TonB-linked outer membrane protein [Ilyomonas limi]|uniref:SusC/RagA family TonB-linked outer membrane protein n=1 Tax=Ilyomonas limi TaxID=2575867 RepID=A0A4V5UW75_9BACT|nr:SusC/RagA family TonB-linked outer membrane protein [Ilyomonas limi]TKK70203.1 SusC/RagA family TonB-linked outer membrane protein [Ilyomonas limi]